MTEVTKGLGAFVASVTHTAIVTVLSLPRSLCLAFNPLSGVLLRVLAAFTSQLEGDIVQVLGTLLLGLKLIG